MNPKICILFVLLVLLQYSSGWKHTIQRKTGGIYLGKSLEPGDVITVTGRYAAGGTDASFDLENENCDRIRRKWKGCLEYNLRIYFGNSIYRRIRRNSNWATFDVANISHIRTDKFHLIIRVKANQIEMVLDDFVFPPWPILLQLPTIDMFNTYGVAVVDTIKYESNNLPL